MITAANIVDEFNKFLLVNFKPDPELFQDLAALLLHLANSNEAPVGRRRCGLFAAVNRKFRFNSAGIADFLKTAAERGLVFNYHEKNRLAAAFDSGDRDQFLKVIMAKDRVKSSSALQGHLSDGFRPVSEDECRSLLHRELRSPTLTRRDSKPRDWSQEILSSLFSAFLFTVYPLQRLHEYIGQLSVDQTYCEDFWEHLHRNSPKLFNRDNTLVFLRIVAEAFARFPSVAPLRESVFRALEVYRTEVTNYGYVAILVEGKAWKFSSPWSFAADVTLFAEKLETTTRNEIGFYRHEQIERETAEYIPELDLRQADFATAYLGFEYRDCFVIGDGPDQKLLLLFQCNRSDETLIPCPACRSMNVQGNSYSSVGVKSWECCNQLCPDRTKFNRGKRYSFLQLLKQRAIEDEDSQIPIASIRQWSRDVVPAQSDDAIVRTVLRHYTLAGDCVTLVDVSGYSNNLLGRKLRHLTLPSASGSDTAGKFYASSYFQRFLVRKRPRTVGGMEQIHINGHTVICGDAYDALSEMPANSIDGAVTSPPYYNAREYSQWANIYVYLYDMYNIAIQVERVLRPGAYFLYNIFDYFDNERTLTMSAMGQRRVILSAYTVSLFRAAGFECMGNIVWDKGEIEGKRAFNNGNLSPYYQAPFNCWEHVLIFRKQNGNQGGGSPFPQLLRQKPVIKMIRGENVHGHSAPFPDEIPELLVRILSPNSIVLDPFAGSLTTSRIAARHQMRSIAIEKDPNYFALGCQKLRDSVMQMSFA